MNLFATEVNRKSMVEIKSASLSLLLKMLRTLITGAFAVQPPMFEVLEKARVRYGELAESIKTADKLQFSNIYEDDEIKQMKQDLTKKKEPPPPPKRDTSFFGPYSDEVMMDPL